MTLSVVLLSAAGIHAMMSFTVALVTAAALLLEGVIENVTDGIAILALPLAPAFMMFGGLLAMLGPARRGLRIEPTEALKAER